MKKLFDRLAIGALLTLSAALSSPALWAFSGQEGASFLDIPVGGRPAALGSAYAAEASDAYAPIYNPAGLGHLRTAELAGMHVSYLETINYEYATFVYPLSIGNALGAAIQYLSPGRVTSRDAAGDVTGDFSGHFAAYSLSYGHHIGDHFALGVTGRVVEGAIASESAHAYAADVGGLWRPNPHLSLAFVATNFGSSLTFIEQHDPLPRAYHLSARLALSPSWMLLAEGVHEDIGLTSGRSGVEWRPVDMFSLRAGFRTDVTRQASGLTGLTAGFGVHAFGQEFDYAWLPMGDLGNSHYFSIVLRFTHAEKERRNIVHVPGNETASELEHEYYEPPLPALGPVPEGGDTTAGASGAKVLTQ